MLNTLLDTSFEQLVDICQRRLEQDCDPAICKEMGMSRSITKGEELRLSFFYQNTDDELYALLDDAKAEAGRRWRASRQEWSAINETANVYNGWHGYGSCDRRMQPIPTSTTLSIDSVPLKSETPLRQFKEEQFRIFTGLTEQMLREVAGRYPFTLGTNKQCVNWLRHNYTDYDEICGNLNREDYLHVFRRFNQLIASHYPWLASECENQIQEKGA